VDFGSANLFKGAVGIFPKSVFFAQIIEEKGIRHIHAHYATHPALSALIISELTGVSFSFTAHAHDIFVHKKMLEEKIKKAGFVVTISEFNKRYILKLCPQINKNKIKVVHCGVDLDLYSSLYMSKTGGIDYNVHTKIGPGVNNHL
jgi:glycosyltransferase involved in cell wall biosynthesis